MTVAELIEKLKGMPQELDVEFRNDLYSAGTVDYVELFPPSDGTISLDEQVVVLGETQHG